MQQSRLSLRNRTHRYAGLVAASALSLAVSLPALAEVSRSDQIVETEIESEEVPFDVVQVLEGLEHPWAVGWLPDGRKLVTERPGRLWLVDGDEVTQVSNTPRVNPDERDGLALAESWQGGLLDLVVHPDYEENGWIYMTYASPGDPDTVIGDAEFGSGTALARARLSDDGTELTDLETLYVQMPRTAPGRHYGSRIAFPGDGTVIFSIGDSGLRAPSQDLTDPAGSMIRLNEDGGAAEDNPLVDRAPGNLRPEIFSFGHRNNQGLTIHPETGEIWTSEHGPRGGDMIHRIEAGNNYGWPQVAYGTEYSTDEMVGIGKSAPGVTPAVHYWDYSMAPSGLAFYVDGHVPGWEGSLFAGSLAEEQLHRLVLDGDSVAHEEILLDGTIGRIRDVRQGPDGRLYLLTDEEEGGLYRLDPVAD